jgi:hypothetical protein
MSLGPGNRSIRLWIPFAATCAMQSYSRIMRGPDCFEHSYPCPLLIP